MGCRTRQDHHQPSRTLRLNIANIAFKSFLHPSDKLIPAMNPDVPEIPPPIVTAGILPGMAMIAIYMLVVGMVGAFGALNGRYPSGRYVILAVSTLIVIGVFGFLRLRRWGWALVTAGCLSLALWIIHVSRITHNPGILVMAALNLCLFLYLVRPEVRERLRR